MCVDQRISKIIWKYLNLTTIFLAIEELLPCVNEVYPSIQPGWFNYNSTNHADF
jgi:hypothetical protein